VRWFREDRGLSQEELAARSGLSVRTVGNVERGGGARWSSADLLMDALALSDAERAAVRRAAAADRAARRRPERMGSGSPGLVRPPPAQLPADVAGFAGRADELARLDRVLARASQEQAAVAVCVVTGVAGVGKTALAVHWAHRVANQFPDGQLYLNLRGFDPGRSAMSPAEALRGCLDALGVPPQRIPADVDTQAALYRSLLAGGRMLVVLDNARDVEQVRPLLPGSPRCLVVVTSRDTLPGVRAAIGAQVVALGLPSAEEARQLLAQRLGADRVAAEPRAIDQIVDRCARLPLALSVVAARAAANAALPLGALAHELRDAHRDLGIFAGGDPATDVRAVFSWSYRALSADAARLFRALALHPGPDVAAPATASLVAIPTGQARRLLAELARAHLVTEPVPGRYAFHDLLRAYATELAQAADSDTGRRAAQHRLLDHYVHTAHHAAVLLCPEADPIALAPPQPGVTPEDLASHESALAWLTAEQPALLAAVEQAIRSGFAAHAWQLASTLAESLRRRGHRHDLAASQRAALEAAQRLADSARQAHAHRQLGGAYTELGCYTDAHAHLRQALDRFGELQDATGQAQAHQGIAQVFAFQGHHRDALGHAEKALELYQAAGHRSGQACALNSIGWDHVLLGDPRRALVYCSQALALHREIGNRLGAAATLDSLGYAHHHLHDYRQATMCYEQAANLYRELGDRHGEADTLTRLGDTHQAAGDTAATEHAWLRALTILDELGHPDADHLHAKLQHLTAAG
jgi:tetratricopeptide (TPR) repeat protein